MELNRTCNMVADAKRTAIRTGVRRGDRESGASFYDYAPFGLLAGIPGILRAEGLSFFTALEEQWGLKLELTREVTDVLVIDSVERPTN